MLLTSVAGHAWAWSLDFFRRFAGDSLEVAARAGRGLDYASDLLFALCPEEFRCLPFTLLVRLHVGKFLCDCHDPVAKSLTARVLLDHAGLRVLTPQPMIALRAVVAAGLLRFGSVLEFAGAAPFTGFEWYAALLGDEASTLRARGT